MGKGDEEVWARRQKEGERRGSVGKKSGGGRVVNKTGGEGG